MFGTLRGLFLFLVIHLVWQNCLLFFGGKTIRELFECETEWIITHQQRHDDNVQQPADTREVHPVLTVHRENKTLLEENVNVSAPAGALQPPVVKLSITRKQQWLGFKHERKNLLQYLFLLEKEAKTIPKVFMWSYSLVNSKVIQWNRETPAGHRTREGRRRRWFWLRWGSCPNLEPSLDPRAWDTDDL